MKLKKVIPRKNDFEYNFHLIISNFSIISNHYHRMKKFYCFKIFIYLQL